MTEEVYVNTNAGEMEMEERGEGSGGIYLCPDDFIEERGEGSGDIYLCPDDLEPIYDDVADQPESQQDATRNTTPPEQLGGKL